MVDTDDTRRTMDAGQRHGYGIIVVCAFLASITHIDIFFLPRNNEITYSSAQHVMVSDRVYYKHKAL